MIFYPENEFTLIFQKLLSFFVCKKFTPLNLLGTNPLEHAFGIIRMRSKDRRNSQRFINEAGKINALIYLNEELILVNIKNRDLELFKSKRSDFVYMTILDECG